MVLKGLLILFVLTKSLSGRWTEAGMRCSSDGKEECVLLGNCQVWSDLLANRGIQDMETRVWHNENLCGFRGREQSDPRVCCPKDKIKPPLGVGVRDKDSELPRTAPITTRLDVCGRVFEETTRIAGGKDAPGPGAWPWVARLLYQINLFITTHIVLHQGGSGDLATCTCLVPTFSSQAFFSQTRRS